MSSSSTSFSPDQHLSPSDQLCYVHCNFCDTVLAVSSITLLFTFLIISLLMQSNCFFPFTLHLPNMLLLLVLCSQTFRWVFLAPVCLRLSLWDVVIAPTFSQSTCVACFFLQLIRFTWATPFSLLKIFWYIYLCACISETKLGLSIDRLFLFLFC